METQLEVKITIGMKRDGRGDFVDDVIINYKHFELNGLHLYELITYFLIHEFPNKWDSASYDAGDGAGIQWIIAPSVSS